jgi:serine/threonine-protein kinase RsbW
MLPLVLFRARRRKTVRSRSSDLLETLVVQAEIPQLARVSNWVDDVARLLALPQPVSFAIHLCLEEALSNIVRYGFAGDQEGPQNKEVRLSLEQVAETIVVTIEDHGVEFDPLAVAAPLAATAITEAPAGGWGIPLMRKFARSLAYERRGGVNRLTIWFTASDKARSYPVAGGSACRLR